MGVASCGKTTLGEALARELGVKFVEGDALHPEANIAKMTAGIPLTDEDRWPWLQHVGEALRGEEGVIAACSALRRAYRDRLREAAGRPVSFLFLDGTSEVLAARIAARKNHFMPPSLLDSQLATLEPPGADEMALRLDLTRPLSELVVLSREWLSNNTLKSKE